MLGRRLMPQDLISFLGKLDLPPQIEDLTMKFTLEEPSHKKEFEDLRSHLAKKYNSLKSLTIGGYHWEREFESLGLAPSLHFLRAYKSVG